MSAKADAAVTATPPAAGAAATAPETVEKSRKERMRELREAKLKADLAEAREAQHKKEAKLRPTAAGAMPADAGPITLTPEQKQEALSQRLKELEAQSALEKAVPGKSATQLLSEASVAEFEDISVTFSQLRWGMRARLTGGPVVITTVSVDSEGHNNGVQVGDVIYCINGVHVDVDRETALAYVRAGGEATVHFKRLKNGSAPIMAGIQGGATGTVKGGGMDAGEMAKLQAMLGHAKGKDTVTYAGVTGASEVIDETAITTASTLVFGNCHDCHYKLETMCTKVFVQGCTNFSLEINSRVLTATVEVYKCQGLAIHFKTKCGTLQADMCKDVSFVFETQDTFYDIADEEDAEKKNSNMIVWAGCHNVSATVVDTGLAFQTTYDDMKKEFSDLVEERSQFRLKLVKSHAGDVRFVQERMTRLLNGFFSTMVETNLFEAKQDSNLKAMAKSMGITMAPAKLHGVKCKPNDTCPQGSGKKFKKCCNRPDGVCMGKPGDW